MERELRKKEKNITKQYWDMVSLLVAVLNHNNLVETEHPVSYTHLTLPTSHLV